MMLVVPASAMAYERCGYRFGVCMYRDVGRDQHRLRYERRDLAHDRHQLQQDLAYGNRGAARAQRADINRDLNRMHWQRQDLAHDYSRMGY